MSSRDTRSVRSSSNAAAIAPASTTTPISASTRFCQPCTVSRVPAAASVVPRLARVITEVRSTRTTAMSSVRPPCACARLLGSVDERVDERRAGQRRHRSRQLEQPVLAQAFIAQTRVPLEQTVGQQHQSGTGWQRDLVCGQSPVCRPSAGAPGGSTQSTVPSWCSSIPG